MQINIKKLSDKAVMPTKAHVSDAGYDLTATSITTAINECGQLVLVYHTDIAIEIPEGYVGYVFPRSSVYKKSLALTNCVGVIDSGYRGEIMAVFKTTTDVVPAVYREGERFAQLIIMPIPNVEFVEAQELSKSDREDNGFGSTDEKFSADETEDSMSTQNESEGIDQAAAEEIISPLENAAEIAE